MGETAGSLLVVDDSDDFRSLYSLWLGAEYDVRTAADGVEAMDVLDERIDVVVLDREMPRKDGIEFARELDASEFDPAVVMISGVVPGEDLLDIPVDDYLQKPVTQDSVWAAVRRGMDLIDCPTPIRRRLALETRLDIVREHTETTGLTDSEAYRRAVEAIDSERQAVQAQAGSEARQPTAAADGPRNSL